MLEPAWQQWQAFSASTPTYTNADDLPIANQRSDNTQGLQHEQLAIMHTNRIKEHCQRLTESQGIVPASTASSASTRISQASTRTYIQNFLATLQLLSGIFSLLLECTSSCNSTLWLLDFSSSMKVKDSQVVVKEWPVWDKNSVLYLLTWHWSVETFSFLVDWREEDHPQFRLCCSLNNALKHTTLKGYQCPLTDQLPITRANQDNIQCWTLAYFSRVRKSLLWFAHRGCPPKRKGKRCVMSNASFGE